ncbi:MAG: dehydrogenase, partial [Aquificaceae bacterium]
LLYSPKTLNPKEGIYSPYEVISSALGKDIDPWSFLSEWGVDIERLRKEGEASIEMKDMSYLDLSSGEVPKGRLFLYTDSTLVEDLGHWNPWTHEMERYQRAYIKPNTAKELGLGQGIEIRGITFELHTTENIAEGVLFIPLDYEEFQPFDPGYRVGAFAEKPYHRYEVLL